MATAQHFNTYDVDYDVRKCKDIIERNSGHTEQDLANDLLRNFPLTQNGVIKSNTCSEPTRSSIWTKCAKSSSIGSAPN